MGNEQLKQSGETNLTPVTAMVNGVLKEHVMPLLREMGLVAAGNEISDPNLSPEDPRRVDFALKCKALSTEICDKLRAENSDPQKVAVVQNYLSSLARLS